MHKISHIHTSLLYLTLNLLLLFFQSEIYCQVCVCVCESKDKWRIILSYIIFKQHQYEQRRQPPTYFHIRNSRRRSRGRRNTHLYYRYVTSSLWVSITEWLSQTHTHTQSQWRIGNRAVIISAINQIIPLPEGRGRIARSVLLQGVGVGLPDPDLLVLVCKSIWSLPNSKDQR